MNKVLILTLMMLSFVSKVKKPHRKIKQRKVCFTCELKKKLWRKKNQHKITKPGQYTIKKETEKGFLVRNKEEILSTSVFIAIIVLIIFLIKKAQLTLKQQRKWNSIKKDFKDQPCQKIFEYLGLNMPLMRREVSLKNIEKFIDTTTGTEKFQNDEIKKAIIKVLEIKEGVQDYESLKDNLLHIFDRNMTKVTSDKPGKITFSNHTNSEWIVHYNNGNPINKDELDKIKNLINAISELIVILSKPDPNESNPTYQELNDLSITFYFYTMLLQTPLEANQYIQGFQETLNKNQAIQQVFTAQNKIKNIMKESNELKQYDLRLVFDIRDGFVLSLYNIDDGVALGSYKPCSEKDNHEEKKPKDYHVGRVICSDLFRKLTEDLEEKTDSQTIQNTLNKICKIIRDLNKKVAPETWEEIKDQITMKNFLELIPQ